MNDGLESHFGNDVLETYAMRQMSSADCVLLEEHLLVCGVCQNRLASVEEYILVVKTAIAALATDRPARIGPQSALTLA